MKNFIMAFNSQEAAEKAVYEVEPGVEASNVTKYRKLVTFYTEKQMAEVEELQRRSAQGSKEKEITIVGAKLAYTLEDGSITTVFQGKMKMTEKKFTELLQSKDCQLIAGKVFNFTEIEDINADDFNHGECEREIAPNVFEYITEDYYWNRRTRNSGSQAVLLARSQEEIKYGNSQNFRLDDSCPEETTELAITEIDVIMDERRTRSEMVYHADKLEADILSAKHKQDLFKAAAGKLFPIEPGTKTKEFRHLAVSKNSEGKKLWILPPNAIRKTDREKLMELYNERKETIMNKIDWLSQRAVDGFKYLERNQLKMGKVIQTVFNKDKDLFWTMFKMIYPKCGPAYPTSGGIRQLFRAVAFPQNKETLSDVLKKRLPEAEKFFNEHKDNMKGLSGNDAAEMIRAAQTIAAATGTKPLSVDVYAMLRDASKLN